MADAKGLKLRRKAKNKGYYAAQFGLTDDNKKRKLGKHLRNFPESLMHQSQEVAEPIFGPNFKAIADGHVANATDKAKHRERKQTTRLLKKIINHKPREGSKDVIGFMDFSTTSLQLIDDLQGYLQFCGWEF